MSNPVPSADCATLRGVLKLNGEPNASREIAYLAARLISLLEAHALKLCNLLVRQSPNQGPRVTILTLCGIGQEHSGGVFEGNLEFLEAQLCGQGLKHLGIFRYQNQRAS